MHVGDFLDALGLRGCALHHLRQLARELHGAIRLHGQGLPVDFLHRRGQVRERLLVLHLARGRLQDVVQHLRHFLCDEGHAPCEHVHEVRQVVRVRGAVELQHVEGAVVELEDRAFIVVDVAIVRRRKNRDHRGEAGGGVGPVHFVALQLRLVGADDGKQLVLVEEAVDVFEGVEVRAASDLVGHEEVVLGILLAGLRGRLVLLVRVRPDQVAEEALARRLLKPVEAGDALERGEVGRQAAMHREELPIDRGRERQGVESVHKRIVHALVVLVLALLAEVEEARHLPALVVSAQHLDSLRVYDLVREEESDDLDGEGAPVDVVAQEDVLPVAGLAADLDELHQVVVLAVDVPDHSDGVVELQQVRLLREQVRGLLD
mmetsp:Transcript_21994/g.62851  ORF Transcript_21994/g.62851 Transcript_21994/m.62851 type:complete len:376 (+) Transcript_21994:482-1609(+)